MKLCYSCRCSGCCFCCCYYCCCCFVVVFVVVFVVFVVVLLLFLLLFSLLLFMFFVCFVFVVVFVAVFVVFVVVVVVVVASCRLQLCRFVTGNGAAASLHSESVVSSIDEVIPPDEPAAAQVDFILSPSEVDFELEEVSISMHTHAQVDTLLHLLFDNIN